MQVASERAPCPEAATFSKCGEGLKLLTTAAAREARTGSAADRVTPFRMVTASIDGTMADPLPSP
jgi:hypothetical protein